MVHEKRETGVLAFNHRIRFYSYCNTAVSCQHRMSKNITTHITKAKLGRTLVVYVMAVYKTKSC